MNRKERRTRGKEMYERLQVLKSSKILNDPRLKALTPNDIKSLQEGTNENESLKTLFKKALKLTEETMFLESEIFAMQKDYAGKMSPTPTPSLDSEEHQPDPLA